MAFGFRVLNSSNQVLVDSDLFHYHFIGYQDPYEKTQVPDILYGPGIQEYGPNENKGMENLPSKGYIYKYVVSTNGPKPPMCFIKPSSTGFSAPYAGIILTAQEGTYWIVWVFQSADSAVPPRLYCFAPLDQISITPIGSTGLATFNKDGQKTFDSRFRPLRIVHGGSLASPPLAHDGLTGSGWTCSLDVNTYSYNSMFKDGGGVSDYIYYAPSLAHACQEYRYSASGSGTSGYKKYAWARSDLWWCFYRAGYRMTGPFLFDSGSTRYIQSNYGVYARGHVYDHKVDETNILVAIVLGVLTGGVYLAIAFGALAASGIFTNAGVASGGYLPYNNGSRNTEANSFLISRASFYNSIYG